MPLTARSGFSGPIGWSVPALIHAPGVDKPPPREQRRGPVSAPGAEEGRCQPVEQRLLDRDVHAEAGCPRDVAGDEATVLDHEHPGRRVAYSRAGVPDGVEERGDRAVAHGVRADRPAPPRARGQRGRQGVPVPHQLAEVTGLVSVGQRHRRRLHAAVEDELQAPGPQQAVARARLDSLLLQGVEVGVHGAGGRDDRGRGQDHGVAADGQLPAGLSADVGVPLGRRHGGVPHGADPVRGVARGRQAEAVDQVPLGERRHDPLCELKRRVLNPAAGFAGRVPVDETAL